MTAGRPGLSARADEADSMHSSVANTNVAQSTFESGDTSSEPRVLDIDAIERRLALKLWAWRIGVALAVLGTWEYGAERWFDPLWTSSPVRIGRFLLEWVQKDLLQHLAITVRETAVGYVAGTALGVLVGAVLARLEFVSRVLDPFIVALNGIPRVALAPLFIIWFGIGELSKMVLASILAFFLCFYATMSGLRAVDQQQINIARVMGASRTQLFLKVSLPSASPWIITAMKVSLPFSLIGAIVGEFIASTAGLGYMIRLFTAQFDTTGAMAGILVLMVAVIIVNSLLDQLEAHALKWRPKKQETGTSEG